MARKQMNLMVNGSDGDDSLKALRGKQTERGRGEMWICQGPCFLAIGKNMESPGSALKGEDS